jgi:PKD repeat protein
VADNIVSYDWNFGDGIGVANGTSVSYTYSNPGDFTAVLTVTSTDGQQDSEQVAISVSQPSVPSDSIVQQTPILPTFDQQNVRDALRAIYSNGIGQGMNPRVFAIVGDDQAVHGGYLDPFADPGLDVSASGLQSIVEWYRQADLADGRSSFDRNGFAASSGRRAQGLLNPERSDPNNCNAGETPLDCELRLIQPSVAVVSVGYNDVLNGTDVNTFRSTMEQIIQTLIGQGVIPIISTVQPIPGMEAQTEAINVAIIEAVRNVEAANGTSVPIYNLWRALNQLSSSGLSGDYVTPSTAPGGAGDLSGDAVANYGTNARNRDTLTVLSALHDQIFPDAP